MGEIPNVRGHLVNGNASNTAYQLSHTQGTASTVA